MYIDYDVLLDNENISLHYGHRFVQKLPLNLYLRSREYTYISFHLESL